MWWILLGNVVQLQVHKFLVRDDLIKSQAGVGSTDIGAQKYFGGHGKLDLVVIELLATKMRRKD